jgi:hypothetical protein
LTLAGFKGSRVQRFKGILFLGFLLTLFYTPLVWSGNTETLNDKQREVEKAAKRYLDAEVRRDFKEVYGSLYPASEYCRANNFEAYRAEAQSSPVRIASYKILTIRITPENPGKEKYPNLEGFARVEVDVTIRYRDSGQQSLVNYDFPFVKEGGRWYKL